MIDKILPEYLLTTDLVIMHNLNTINLSKNVKQTEKNSLFEGLLIFEF